MYLVMSFETTPVVVGVEGPCSAVGGLETPGNLIKKKWKTDGTGEEGGTGWSLRCKR